MRRFTIIFAALLMLAPAALQAEGGPSPAGEADADAVETPDTPDTSERKRHSPRDIEWASVAIGTGGFLVNGRVSAPTFVWERFYWTTLHTEVLVFKARESFRSMGGVICQSFGYPWYIDPAGRQELRGGILAGFLITANFPLLARNESPPEAHFTPYWLGFALGPELTYLYHFRKHLSLTAGFRSAFAVAGDGDYYPFPYLAGQVGLAF